MAEGRFPIRRQLFAFGFITLFLELALIRFLAGSIWNLGYFPNLVLLAAFVGMGIGFVFHRVIPDAYSGRALMAAAGLNLLLAIFVSTLHPRLPGFGNSSGEIGGELYFTILKEGLGASGWAPFLVWFVLVLCIFALICQAKAKVFRTLPPLNAYTADISGSIVGILSFMGVSRLTLPAFAWFILLIPAFYFAFPSERRKTALLTCLVLALTSAMARLQDQKPLFEHAGPDEFEVHWSPYQKLEYLKASRFLYGNGIPHQAMLTAPDVRRGIYEAPYAARRERLGKTNVRRVLVIGAGSGNDVAAALLNGVEHVDAVEIDPVIAGIGKRHNPVGVYQDPRVNVVIDDGRAFLTRSREKYDLIIFALTDSLVKISGMAQIRLENYLFTVQAFRRAFELLNENGELVLYNYYRTNWLVDKLRGMLVAATGRMPRSRTFPDHCAIFMVGNQDDAFRLTGAYRKTLSLATDNWPFLYLKRPAFPPLYALAIGVVLVALVGAFGIGHFLLRAVGVARPKETSLSLKLVFLLMGAAFLLLETKSVIQFSLLFGTTWINTSLVFLGILILVLAGIYLARRFSGPRAIPISFVLLIVTSMVPLLFPLSKLLLVESVGLRFVLASLLTFSPILFANLLFALIFRHQEVAEELMGWNLMGATLGGLAEYLSMWVGYRSLALVVAGLYAAAYALLIQACRATVDVTPLGIPFPSSRSFRRSSSGHSGIQEISEPASH